MSITPQKRSSQRFFAQIPGIGKQSWGRHIKPIENPRVFHRSTDCLKEMSGIAIPKQGGNGMNKLAGLLGVLAIIAGTPLARADFQISVNGVNCTPTAGT